MLPRSAALLRARPRGAAHVVAASRQSRSFLTGNTMSKYWMKRAKILHIIGRMVVAYPQMHNIPDPDAPINKLFSRDATERERAFMFVLSQVPPDEPIDLAEFLSGASDVAQVILPEVYRDLPTDDSILTTMALPDCVATWKQKRQQVVKLVGASEDVRLTLESVEVKHAGISEVNYTYSDARGKDDQQEETLTEERKSSGRAIDESTVPSMFLMHEAIQIKVQFDVREHLRIEGVVAKETSLPDSRAVAVESTFEWTFDSDVSRAELVDWVITSVSPFTSTIAPKDDEDDDIAEKTL